MDSTEIQAGDREQLRDQALARSVLYGALSLALDVPAEEILRRLQAESAKQTLREAASFLAHGEQEAEPTADLVARVEDWVRAFESLTLEQWLTTHGRLFGHTARGVVCPYEAEYGQEGLFEQPRRLAQIVGFYRAFGLVPREEERERPDHLSCELEFLDFLSRKEAVALEARQEETRQETHKAVRLFLKDHVGRVGPTFARGLRKEDEQGFYGRLGDALFDFLTLECRRLQVEAGPVLLPLRSAEEDDVPMACGGESELIQLQAPK